MLFQRPSARLKVDKGGSAEERGNNAAGGNAQKPKACILSYFRLCGHVPNAPDLVERKDAQDHQASHKHHDTYKIYKFTKRVACSCPGNNPAFSMQEPVTPILRRQ